MPSMVGYLNHWATAALCDNRRIFMSRQRRLESSFEDRRAKKIKTSKEIELFQEQEVVSDEDLCAVGSGFESRRR
ncbi:hypothetical protein TNCV_2000951 [Trichonephila clavipes]|nr:hypothetical protein TNCV_2000951 [Trichonephila clavipes]